MGELIGVLVLSIVFFMGWGARGCWTTLDCEETQREVACKATCGERSSTVQGTTCYCADKPPAEKP